MTMSLTTPTLHTARLRLRPFTEGDTDAIYALMRNASVLRYWDAPPWSDRAQADRFIARCNEMEQEGMGVRLAIERTTGEGFIGNDIRQTPRTTARGNDEMAGLDRGAMFAADHLDRVGS